MSTTFSKIYSILFYIFITVTVNAFTILIDDFSDTDEQDHTLSKGSEIPGLCRNLYADDISLTLNSLKTTDNNAIGSITYTLPNNEFFKFDDYCFLKIAHTPNNLKGPLKLNVSYITENMASMIYTLHLPTDNNHIYTDLSLLAGEESYTIPKGGIRNTVGTEHTNGLPFATEKNKITNIIFDINPDNEMTGLWEINSIDAVPEPFSILTLGGGITALIRKKKKYYNS